MPARKIRNPRRKGLSDGALAWLRGERTLWHLCNSEEIGWHYHETEAALAETWADSRDWVLAEHVAASPGTRPQHWWTYDAPEPRLRLGGTGTPSHDVLAVLAQYRRGVPTLWITESDVRIFRDGGGGRDPDPAWPGVAIDPDDPPLFESEAAYLDRHGLFLTGEKRRLRTADFEPEAIGLADT